MAVKNYYTVLGVNQTDSEDSIKKAYRKLAKKYHPDSNPGDKAAETKMQEIAEAWETLGNEKKRAQYDGELSGSAKQKAFTAGPVKTPSSGRPMTQEDFFNMTRNFNDSLSPEAIKNSVNRKKASGKGPIDTTDFFEKVMGFKI